MIVTDPDDGLVVDLFAGPGGWDLAARRMGLDPIGLELDAAACATRAAAGLRTIRADVASYPVAHLAGIVAGVIASPPCPDFSRGGRRAGVAGATGHLVHEVLRWALTIRPAWLACEQVPEVLPFWRSFAGDLERAGYRTWAGILNAADYGVAQARRRSFLLARIDRPVAPPPATHAADPGLFGLLPHVTMAEACGWPPGGPDAGWELNTGRDWKKGGTRDDAQRIPLTSPAPTVAGVQTQWAWRRPARTISGTVGGVGGRFGHRGDGARGERHINVTVAEATALQSFPPDYPWAGNVKACWKQVGNAVPPLLAEAVLRSVT